MIQNSRFTKNNTEKRALRKAQGRCHQYHRKKVKATVKDHDLKQKTRHCKTALPKNLIDGNTEEDQAFRVKENNSNQTQFFRNSLLLIIIIWNLTLYRLIYWRKVIIFKDSIIVKFWLPAMKNLFISQKHKFRPIWLANCCINLKKTFNNSSRHLQRPNLQRTSNHTNRTQTASILTSVNQEQEWPWTRCVCLKAKEIISQ